MKDDSTLEQIETIARVRLGLQQPLAPDAHLVDDLALDSLQRMTLAVEIENHFRICLDPEDEAEIETVADLLAVIQRKTSSENAEPDS